MRTVVSPSGKLPSGDLAERHAEVLGDALGQRPVGPAAEDLELVVVSVAEDHPVRLLNEPCERSGIIGRARGRLPVFVKLRVCRVGRESGIVSARSRRLFTPARPRYPLHPRTRYARFPCPTSPTVRDHLALALVPGLGPKLTAALLARFGSAGRRPAGHRRRAPRNPAHRRQARRRARRRARARSTSSPELRLMEEHGVRPCRSASPATRRRWPALSAPPPLLYFRGEWMPADANAIGIVGSRAARATACADRGADRAGPGPRRLHRRLGPGARHRRRGPPRRTRRGRADGRGLAGGLSRIYPPEHAPLADEITAGRGCLVTETPMVMEPQPGMFPARNRIISGLSRAVDRRGGQRQVGALSPPATRPSRAARFTPSPVRSIASPVLAAMSLFAMAHGSSAARMM